MATPIAPRESSDDNLGRVMSHGRGGAENIGHDTDGYKESEEELKIPTLKSQVYTTGRGGSENMTANDPMRPGLARAAQDVESGPLRPSSAEFHGGRGVESHLDGWSVRSTDHLLQGVGNVVAPPDYEAEMQRVEDERQKLATQQANLNAQSEEKIDYRGWADRGKDALLAKLGRGKKQTAN